MDQKRPSSLQSSGRAWPVMRSLHVGPGTQSDISFWLRWGRMLDSNSELPALLGLLLLSRPILPGREHSS